MWDDTAFAGTSMGPRCYESHKGLKLGVGKLYGGSASSPIVKDADVYVALQSGSTSGRSSDPWDAPGVVEVHYSIQDMRQPSDAARFKKMVSWICTQLHDGKTVHVGCIGGHGRTGTVLSAVVAEMLDEKNAIQYVRQHYCKRAVESREQIQFLVKHYGIEMAEPTKGDVSTGKWKSNGKAPSYPTWHDSLPVQGKLRDRPRHLPGFGGKSEPKLAKPRKIIPEGVTSKTKVYAPMESSRSLWRKRKP
jgi:hypothetical protein